MKNNDGICSNIVTYFLSPNEWLLNIATNYLIFHTKFKHSTFLNFNFK